MNTQTYKPIGTKMWMILYRDDKEQIQVVLTDNKETVHRFLENVKTDIKFRCQVVDFTLNV